MRKALTWIVIAVAFYLAMDEFSTSVEQVNLASRAYRSGPPIAASLSGPLQSALPNPVQVANNYLKEHRDQFQIQSYHELRPVPIATASGTTVKYSVYQDKLPIIGLGIEIKIAKDFSVEGLENNYRPVQAADLSNTGIPLKKILERVSQRYIAEETSVAHASSILYLDSVSAAPELVYVVSLKENLGKGRNLQVLFRASDGLILGKSLAVKK